VNSMWVPDEGACGPYRLLLGSGFSSRFAYAGNVKKWVQEREWILNRNSILLIRCGSAVNAIGVELYRTMVGDRMMGHYYKDRGGDILGVKVYVGHPPGDETQCGIVGLSFLRQDGWTRRYGGTEMDCQLWPVTASYTVVPPKPEEGKQIKMAKKEVNREDKPNAEAAAAAVGSIASAGKRETPVTDARAPAMAPRDKAAALGAKYTTHGEKARGKGTRLVEHQICSLQLINGGGDDHGSNNKGDSRNVEASSLNTGRWVLKRLRACAPSKTSGFLGSLKLGWEFVEITRREAQI